MRKLPADYAQTQNDCSNLYKLLELNNRHKGNPTQISYHITSTQVSQKTEFRKENS